MSELADRVNMGFFEPTRKPEPPEEPDGEVIDPSFTEDPVNHPYHYVAHPSGVECIEITRHMNFCLGNAMKYIWRAGLKGDALEDLRKAAWYIDDEIKRLEKGAKNE